MNMKFKFNPLAFAALVCLGSPCLAQDAAATPPQASASSAQVSKPAPAEETLAETVVTATRTPTAVNETPGATYVVTQQQMQTRNLQTADAAVSTVPGVYVNRSKGMMDTAAAVTLRGFSGAGRSLIMLDGMPVNSGYTTGVNFAGLSASDFSRVEVALGAGASLYGNSAMGGVVNYVSRMPEKREFNFKLGYGSALGSDFGTRNLKRAYVSYGDKFVNGLSLFTSFSMADTDGFRATRAQASNKPAGTTGGFATTTVTGSPLYVVGESGENQWRENSFTLRAALDLPQNGQWRVGYMRNQYKNSYGLPKTYLQKSGAEFFPTTGITQHYNYLAPGKTVSELFQTSLEAGLGKGRLAVNLGLLRSNTNWYVNPPRGGDPVNAYLHGAAASMSERPNRAIYGDAQYTFSPLDKHLVVVGASLRDEKADVADYALADWRDTGSKTRTTLLRGGKTRNIGLFAQDEIAVTNKFTATLGLRWDKWKTSGGYYDADGDGPRPVSAIAGQSQSALSPKMGLRYRFSDNFQLRASVGKAFRTPNIYELYGSYNASGRTQVPNFGLKPETAITWDIGADMQPWPGAQVKATLYMNQLRDLIYSRDYSEGGKLLRKYENLGKGRGHGLELDFRQKIGNDWTLLANAAFNKTRIQENSNAPNTVGNAFTHVPKTTANLGVEWSRGPWAASGWVHHVSKRYGNERNDDVVNSVMGSRDPYTIANLKGSYQINKNLKVSLAVDNAFNRKYWSGYYRAPGRSYFLELAGTF